MSPREHDDTGRLIFHVRIITHRQSRVSRLVFRMITQKQYGEDERFGENMASESPQMSCLVLRTNNSPLQIPKKPTRQHLVDLANGDAFTCCISAVRSLISDKNIEPCLRARRLVLRIGHGPNYRRQQ